MKSHRTLLLAAILSLVYPNHATAEPNRQAPASIIQNMIKAAERGNAEGQLKLAAAYELGWGVPENYPIALKWYRKAADQRLASAQSKLGMIHHLGLGVAQDYAEALKWYRKAADQGEMWSQFNLGMMYYLGKGVPQNHVKAHMWSNLSSIGLQGDGQKQAAELRNKIAKEMTLRQIAEAQRMACEWIPALSK